MVICDDQKLRVILPDDDAGTAAFRFLQLRLLIIISERIEIILHFLDRLVGDRYNGRHCGFRDIRDIQAAFGGAGGCGNLAGIQKAGRSGSSF